MARTLSCYAAVAPDFVRLRQENVCVIQPCNLQQKETRSYFHKLISLDLRLLQTDHP